LAVSIDSVDRDILRLLKLNARQSNAQIAAEIGLSPSACHRRIKLMEQNGVIRGYTVLSGGGGEQDRRSNFLIQVTLDRQTEDYLGRFEHAVRQIPEVRECFLMTGAADYWLRVETEINSSFAMRDAMRPRMQRR